MRHGADDIVCGLPLMCVCVQLFFRLAATYRYWLSVIVTVLACVLLDVLVHSLYLFYSPTPTMLFVEAERLGKDLHSIAQNLQSQQEHVDNRHLLQQFQREHKLTEHQIKSFESGRRTRRRPRRSGITTTADDNVVRVHLEGAERKYNAAEEEDSYSSSSSEGEEVKRDAAHPRAARKHKYSGFAFSHTENVRSIIDEDNIDEHHFDAQREVRNNNAPSSSSGDNKQNGQS